MCLFVKRDNNRPYIALKTPKTKYQHKEWSFRNSLNKFSKFSNSHGGSVGGQKKGNWPFFTYFLCF